MKLYDSAIANHLGNIVFNINDKMLIKRVKKRMNFRYLMIPNTPEERRGDIKNLISVSYHLLWPYTIHWKSNRPLI